MQTGNLTIKANSHATRNLLIIGGTAGLGAAIGGGAGGGKGAAIGALAGAGAGTAGAYLTGQREIVLPAETLLTFHVTSVTISPNELARLQRAGHGAEIVPVPYPSEPYPVVVERRRRHHDDDDDDDEDDDDDYEHEYRRPKTIAVVFHSGHRAAIVIHWPRRIERFTLEGDDLDDILEPLSEHCRLSVEFLRPRVRIRRDDD